MFADIQGKYTVYLNICRPPAYKDVGSMDRHNFVPNESALTLFDPMSHTPRG
jgi:hypothetical protein